MNKVFLSFILIASLGAQAMHHEMNHDNHQDAKSIVQQVYETFASGDMEAWAALHADNVVFTVFGDIATSGKHIGPEAVIKNVFEPIGVHWPTFTLTPKVMYSDGDMVFVHSDMTADGLATETMHMFEVKNGIIQTFTAFDDTDSMASADVQ